MKIAELFAEVGFDIDSAPLGDFTNMLGGAAAKMTAVIAAAAAAAFAIKQVTDRSIAAAASMRSFRIETGLSTVELQRFQAAVQLTDISASAEDVASSISSLQSNLAQIRLGQGNIRPFQLLGVSAAGDAFDVIEQLRGAVRGLDEATAVNLLQEMGLGPEFLHILRLSREEFEELANRYVLSDQQLNKLTQLGTAFQDLGLYINHATDELSAFIAPALIAGVNHIKDVTKVAAVPFKILGDLVGIVNQQFQRLDDLTSGGLSSGLEKITRVMSMMAKTFSFFGMFPLLIIEDIYTGLNGGNSLLLSGFRVLANKIKEIFEPVAEFIQQYVIDPFNMVRDKIENLPTPSVAFDGAVDAAGGAFDRLGSSVSNMFNNVFNITTSDPQAAAGAITNGIQQQLNFGLSDVNNSGAF